MPNPTLRRTTVYTLTVPRPKASDLDEYLDALAATIQAVEGPRATITSKARSRADSTVQVSWRSPTDGAAARATADAVTSDPAAVLHTGFGIHKRIL